MGFFAMATSMLLGIFLVAFGINRRKINHWYLISSALGIVFVLLAIYLGFPK